ncbi:type II secretion system F family protein [Hahella sp. KA22]|uniref:type II secretion system F family protein n=1 Tax=Hahella sp. KA22 TaxID=1628392 RepID=UPI000FDF08C2|nr:type II secretion system F family protein [Hahella sp. KA22]AZZ94555.1 type II secretion system F family protein [Hahella sp. KA22]QAY57928.1 type II secretion system F family protein [Hahella sp. KA22]
MANFAFKGRDSKGALIEGVQEAVNREALANELLRKGVTPTSIQEQEAQTDVLLWLKKLPIFRKKVTLDELVILCRQMHALSRAGIPIIRAIRGLAESTRSETLAEVLDDVARRLEGGVNLATAMRAHPRTFNELFVSMILVGENTGQLEESFRQLGENIELERDTRKRVAQAVRYPIMVVVAITIALLVVNFFVIPAFAGVFAKFGADLPLPTKILVATSSFLINYGWFVAAGLAAAIYGFIRWKKTPQGAYRWDRFKLRIPIVGPLFELVALSRFSRNFSMMLAAGLPVTSALTLVAEAVDNKYVGSAIADMRNGIERGDTLVRTARATNMFSPLVMQMLAVGEETGAVDSLLVEVANFYDEEIEYSLKRLAESIEPILLVVMGVMVLILALGVFLPMWSLGQAALGK